MSRIYTDAIRAEAVGFAHTLGDKEASKRTGVPSRTIRRWMQLFRQGDDRALAIMDAPTREAVAAKLWEGVTIGADAVVSGLNDPKARLGDKARALEVLASQHALLTGGPTSRTETYGAHPETADPDSRQWWEQVLGGPLTEGEQRCLRDTIDRVQEWVMVALVAELREARDEGREPVTLTPSTPLRDLPAYLITEDRKTAPRLPVGVEPAQLGDGRNGS